MTTDEVKATIEAATKAAGVPGRCDVSIDGLKVDLYFMGDDGVAHSWGCQLGKDIDMSDVLRLSVQAFTLGY